MASHSNKQTSTQIPMFLFFGHYLTRFCTSGKPRLDDHQCIKSLLQFLFCCLGKMCSTASATVPYCTTMALKIQSHFELDKVCTVESNFHTPTAVLKAKAVTTQKPVAQKLHISLLWPQLKIKDLELSKLCYLAFLEQSTV